MECFPEKLDIWKPNAVWKTSSSPTFGPWWFYTLGKQKLFLGCLADLFGWPVLGVIPVCLLFHIKGITQRPRKQRDRTCHFQSVERELSSANRKEGKYGERFFPLCPDSLLGMVTSPKTYGPLREVRTSHSPELGLLEQMALEGKMLNLVHTLQTLPHPDLLTSTGSCDAFE